MCELLKYERKMLRARISILRNEKFIQNRLKMETGPDGKAQKAYYYFINYKTFVNVVKYKLDLMRKRMETEERDATSRASFKCPECLKTFTDLEADQLFDPMSGEFRCTYCGVNVEEDKSALPKKDSRLLMARFNEQMQPLYDLLRQVEDIKLAPELLEPEPTDLDTIRGINKNDNRLNEGQWSGELSRSQGFAPEETRVDISIGENDGDANKELAKKDRPIWLTESTVISNDEEDELEKAAKSSVTAQTSAGPKGKRENLDILSVLLQHEKNQQKNPMGTSDKNDSSDSDSDEDPDKIDISQVATMDDDDDADEVPTVMVGGVSYPVDEIEDTLIAKMTPQEKEVYIQVYQDHFSLMYE